MAYKFQLGAFTASGSITSTDDIDATGDLTGSNLSVTTTASVGFLEASGDISGSGQLKILSISFNNDSFNINQQGAYDGLSFSGSSFVSASSLNIGNGSATIAANGATSLASLSLTTELAVADGGTGAGTASDARTNLGLAIGSDVQAHDAQLDSLSGMSPAAATALALLSNAEIELLDGATSENDIVSKVAVLDGQGNLTISGSLTVNGTTTTISTTNLEVEDKNILIASGAASAVAAEGSGLTVDFVNAQWKYEGNGEGDASTSGAIWIASGSTGLIDIQAAEFYGDGSNLTGVSADTIIYSVASKADGNTLEKNKVNYFANLSSDAAVTMPTVTDDDFGAQLFIKAKDLTNGATITINTANAAQKIDAQDSIILESPYAAVTLIYVATDDWRVF